MSDIIIMGPAPSSYLRSTRMACVEKEIEHELRPLDVGTDAHRDRHPYYKVPVLEHGDVRLWETNAIIHYLDGAFDSGTPLIPRENVARARAEQWVSALNCYMYKNFVIDYAFAYIRAGATGPDRERIERSMEATEYDLDLLEGQLAQFPYLAGDAISHADLMLATAVQTITMFPEGQAAVAGRPKLSAWMDGIGDRPSARFLAPPPPPA